MVAVTYRHGLDKPAAAPARKRKGIFVRILNALQESQLRRAEREISLHRHLLPHDLERFGDTLSPRSEDTLPFGRR